jgi:hypothetical protein
MKTVASVLLVLLLSAQTPIGQVFKLPFLVEHFIKHQQQTGTSLIGFIIDHYSHKHHDADQSEDQQLPFKTVILLNMASAIVPPLIKPDFGVEFKCPQKLTLSDFHKPQQYLCNIFHPPCVTA